MSEADADPGRNEPPLGAPPSYRSIRTDLRRVPVRPRRRRYHLVRSAGAAPLHPPPRPLVTGPASPLPWQIPFHASGTSRKERQKAPSAKPRLWHIVFGNRREMSETKAGGKRNCSAWEEKKKWNSLHAEQTKLNKNKTKQATLEDLSHFLNNCAATPERLCMFADSNSKSHFN